MKPETLHILKAEAIDLLKQVIAVPSFSKEEHATADILADFLSNHNVQVNRHLNNIWAVNQYYDAAKPTILLNSHHDTVKPNKGYTLDPFAPIEKDGKLYGLGSNDAGGCLVSLIACFLYFHPKADLPFNVALAASAEEEISGFNGIEAVLPVMPPIWCAVVGEPTKMQMAIAERGLLVLDCVATGKAGHAARNEGESALYKAIADIERLRAIRFDKGSDLLGPVTVNVTVIETDNKAHNVVPAECRFVADVRVNEQYTLQEVLAVIQRELECSVSARSLRMRSTGISPDHPLVMSGLQMNKTCYGSPTTSDKALMDFPALKMGPGDSARSHTADEFIFIDEIHAGIDDYIQLLNQLL